jgi:hypothetical protein
MHAYQYAYVHALYLHDTGWLQAKNVSMHVKV